MASTIGVDVRFLTAAQVKEIWPLCNVDGVIGAIQHPDDGYIQPADLTQAFAKGARAGGAEIYRNTNVTGIEQRRGGEWLVKTDKGDIVCEHVVSATGNFARKTGEMVGLDVPVIPVEHQYLVTEPHPAIQRAQEARGCRRWACCASRMRPITCARKPTACCWGPTRRARPAATSTAPRPSSEYELFPEDLDRLAPHIDAAINRVPAFAEVGIKKIHQRRHRLYARRRPDRGPRLGPEEFLAQRGPQLWGHRSRRRWLAAGRVDRRGRAQHRHDGSSDPRRFGPYASRGYLRKKNEEAYAAVFTIHYPDEERAGARPLKQSPCYDRMKARGAVFGTVYGWERPGWFAPAGYGLDDKALAKPDVLLNDNHARAALGERPRERWSFRRSNYFEHVGNECKHVSNAVGLLDMTAFAKFEVAGHGAEQWLEWIFANRMPKKIGGLALCHLLTRRGGVRTEATVLREAPQQFYLVSAGAFERHDWDYFQKLLPTDGSVRMQKVTTQYGVFVLAGPRSRELLQKLTDTDLSNGAFPWLTGKPISVGAAQARALRVNFVGELGWELHHPIEMQNYLFDLLFAAGEEFDLKPFGIKAMDSLRLEKSYRLIPREMSIEYSILESGLDRFARLDKGNFLGRDGLIEWQRRGFKNRFVTLEVHGVKDADARGSEPIHSGGQIVGRTTSGGFGWRLGKSLALGMVSPELAAAGHTAGDHRAGRALPRNGYRGIAVRSEERAAAGVETGADFK